MRSNNQNGPGFRFYIDITRKNGIQPLQRNLQLLPEQIHHAVIIVDSGSGETRDKACQYRASNNPLSISSGPQPAGEKASSWKTLLTKRIARAQGMATS